MSIAQPAHIRLDRAANGMVMTPEEFDAVDDYDDRYRYELIHGVVVVSPIPSEAEGDPNEELGRWIRNYKESHPHGSVVDCTLPERYVRTRDSRRRADRVIWIGLGRVPDPLVDVPRIVVEFVSLRRRDWLRDYFEKQTEYMAVGVAEYWIIDRFRRRLTVYRATANGVVEVVVGEAEVYRTDLLPGFELPLARLFVLADLWGG
jgi:Uma2 family endonuclease